MKKKLWLLIIVIVLIIDIVFLFLVSPLKSQKYNQIEIYNSLKTKNVSLLQCKIILNNSGYTSFVEFIDGKLENNCIELYNENIQSLNYDSLDNYCKIIIFKTNTEAQENEKKFISMKNYMFKEKNVIFITNNISLKEKYLKILRKIKGREYD